MSAEWYRGCQLAEEASEARTVFKGTLLAHDPAIRPCSVRAGERCWSRGRDSEMLAVITGGAKQVKDHFALSLRNLTVK